MKLSRTSWIVLGVGLFVIAGITLYVVYQGQAGDRQDARDRLAEAQAALPAVISEKNDAESQLGQLEDELAQWQSELDQLETDLAQVELALAQAKLRLPGSVESIEYGEKLFALADSSNLDVAILNASEAIDVQIEGISYSTTSFTLEVWGRVADILDFINAAVADNDFRTAVLEPISISMPELLTDAEKEDIEETIRAELTAEAIAELTTEDIIGFMLEAIAEVTGQQIGTLTVEEIAETIRGKIASLVEEDFVALLPGDLAELIEEHIVGSIVDTIVGPLAQEIADLITAAGEEGFLEEDLVALLGEDMAGLLGEGIAGALPGEIEDLLSEYIAKLVEEKMAESVAGLVEGVVGVLAAEQIAEIEQPAVIINLIIYAYKGE